MTAPHPCTAAAERRRIIAAGDARAAQLTQTPRKPQDAVVRLTGGKEDE